MATTAFGSQLRDWRRLRGVSQLDLASTAEVSQRHISFLETGRSRPSREMVLHLGAVLDIPLRERNLLLTSAGHTPAYAETPLDELDQVSAVLDLMIEAHEPNLAIVLDRHWNVVRANKAALVFSAHFFPDPPDWLQDSLNIMRAFFHPEGLRHRMADWDTTAVVLRRRLEREVASHPHDHDLRRLYDEMTAYPGVADLPRGMPEAAAGDLVVPSTYVVEGEEISLFSTIATIGDAHDITLAELRIETFWPVDAVSAQRWDRHFA